MYHHPNLMAAIALENAASIFFYDLYLYCNLPLI